VSPDFLETFGGVSFDGSDTDLDALPSLAIDGIAPSSEDEYEADKEERADAEEAADALFGEADDSDEAEADDSEEEAVAVSDEEIGIVE
jgi:hypothetical protein